MMKLEEMEAAEARVRALRDEVARVAERLEAEEPVVIAEVLERLERACAAIHDGDLGPDGATVGIQFGAMFDRLRALVGDYPDPVPTNSLGLSVDARFLRDMATFLTRRYGLGED